jgi:hypothetical protein
LSSWAGTIATCTNGVFPPARDLSRVSNSDEQADATEIPEGTQNRIRLYTLLCLPG